MLSVSGLYILGNYALIHQYFTKLLGIVSSFTNANIYARLNSFFHGEFADKKHSKQNECHELRKANDYGGPL